MNCTIWIIAVLGWSLITGPAVGARMTDEQAIDQLRTINQAYTAIAARVTKSVVTITTKRLEEAGGRGRRMPDIFGHPFQLPQPEERESSGLGSGIIMTVSGYILTNNHVVEKADEITVIMSDNREYPAELVGTDALTDVAVIKIEAEDLSAITTGDSDGIQIGEWVLAVGAPLDLRSTVTSGIVSAMGRSLDIIDGGLSIEDFIQVDAAINPGNSGGALVNIDGELIGVNTAIATRNRGGFVGYGFAIPINLAKKVMDDIVTHGEVRRAYLGVSLTTVSAAMADAMGLERPMGVLIGEVLEGTPAYKAGFKREDIVLKVDGESVDRPNHLQSIIARKHPEDVAKFSIWRKDRNIELTATLGALPKNGEEVAAVETEEGSETESLGLTVSDITPQIMESFGLSEETKGVVVTRIERGPGSSAGFMRGDVIFAIRQNPLDVTIDDVADFEEATKDLMPNRSAAFSVIRRDRSGEERYLFLTPRIPG